MATTLREQFNEYVQQNFDGREPVETVLPIDGSVEGSFGFEGLEYEPSSPGVTVFHVNVTTPSIGLGQAKASVYA